MATFAEKHPNLIDKKSKIEIGSSLIETAPDLIPPSADDLNSRFKRFKSACKSAGFSNYGIREYKCCLLMCIKHFLNLSLPELINPSDYDVAPSLAAADVNIKVGKALMLYQLALPKIREHVIY